MADKPEFQGVLNELIRREKENTRRLRALEEREKIFDARISSLQESFLREIDDRKKELNETNGKLKELENRIIEMENSIRKIERNLENVAKKSELFELKNIIDLYSPLKSSFVSKDEVKKMIAERV